MNTDMHALLGVAQTYFDAAYEMDADRFASIFHPSSSVTKVVDDGTVMVIPIETWLETVRNTKGPKSQGLDRDDQVLSMDVAAELALLKVRLQVGQRRFTDMLSCLKVDGAWKIVQKVMTTKA